ncbi:MAG: serine hydrolase, partial [Gammaproteobacteria bacterium]|nr:serine hydrolase [Gammaproteobacteria bacterium]
MRANRPPRGAHAPGKFFYDNNWDVSALAAIIERATGKGLGQLIDEWLAQPTGMQDFLPEHVIYRTADTSAHRQFIIYMSARDLARLGALFLEDGRWGDVQVVPGAWLDESTTRYSSLSDAGLFDGYGYLWWLDTDIYTDFETVWGRRVGWSVHDHRSRQRVGGGDAQGYGAATWRSA